MLSYQTVLTRSVHSANPSASSVSSTSTSSSSSASTSGFGSSSDGAKCRLKHVQGTRIFGLAPWRAGEANGHTLDPTDFPASHQPTAAQAKDSSTHTKAVAAAEAQFSDELAALEVWQIHTHAHTHPPAHKHTNPATHTHTHTHTHTRPHNHLTTQPHNHIITQPHNHAPERFGKRLRWRWRILPRRARSRTRPETNNNYLHLTTKHGYLII